MTRSAEEGRIQQRIAKYLLYHTKDFTKKKKNFKLNLVLYFISMQWDEVT